MYKSRKRSKNLKEKRVCFSFNHKMNRKGSTHYNTLAAISDTHTITDPITIQNNDRKPFQFENWRKYFSCNIVCIIVNNPYPKTIYL